VSCVFCEIVAEMDETKVTEVTPAVVMFEPLNPVTDGHLLLVPKKHVTDMSESVNTMRFIGEAIAMITRAYPECNVITSKGVNATQSIFHLHVHIVPRTKDDGLMLPWTKKLATPTNLIGDKEQ
jgi:histidine triad (HIT) family protein